MKKRSLLINATIAAMAIAGGNAFAQSENTPAGPRGGMAPAEMAPPAAGNRAQPMDRGASGDPGAGGSDLERRSRGAETGLSDEGGPQGKDWAGSKTKPERKAGDGSAARGGPDDATTRDATTKDAKTGEAAKGEAAKGDKSPDKSKSAEKPDKGWKKDAGDASSGRDAATGASEGAEGRDHVPSGSVTQLSGERRTKVQSAFRSHRSGAVVKDIDINLNVGVAVPRSVVLYAVPEDVVVIVPEYQRYKYFVFDDKVVIVDPDTFAIVDILILA